MSSILEYLSVGFGVAFSAQNLLVAAITLILGTGDYTLKFGSFALGGIGTATFGAIFLYALLTRRKG